MREFEIELLGVTNDGYLTKFKYTVKTEGFEAMVSVLSDDKEQAFVHEHICTEGAKLLWCYGFWSDLQFRVLEFHNKLKEEAK